jgi:hypothetical protein
MPVNILTKLLSHSGLGKEYAVGCIMVDKPLKNARVFIHTRMEI